MAFGIPILRILSSACSVEAEGRKQDVLSQL